MMCAGVACFDIQRNVMTLLKIAGLTFILLASISAGVIYYTFSHIDEYVAGIIEQTGSELTQTAVYMDRADVNVRQGRGALYHLSIANPAGYSPNKLYVSNKIAFKVDLSSINQPVKVINKADVRDVYFSVEQKGVKNNLQTVMNTILSGLNNGSVSTIANDKGVEQPVVTSIKAMVERITFSSVQVALYVDEADVHLFTVPSFFIENIGDKSTGLSPKDLGRHMTLHLMKVVSVAVQEELAVLSQQGAQKSVNENAQDILGKQLQNTSPLEIN
jgi:hypothetical protein